MLLSWGHKAWPSQSFLWLESAKEVNSNLTRWRDTLPQKAVFDLLQEGEGEVEFSVGFWVVPGSPSEAPCLHRASRVSHLPDLSDLTLWFLGEQNLSPGKVESTQKRGRNRKEREEKGKRKLWVPFQRILSCSYMRTDCGNSDVLRGTLGHTRPCLPSCNWKQIFHSHLGPASLFLIPSALKHLCKALVSWLSPACRLTPSHGGGFTEAMAPEVHHHYSHCLSPWGLTVAFPENTERISFPSTHTWFCPRLPFGNSWLSGHFCRRQGFSWKQNFLKEIASSLKAVETGLLTGPHLVEVHRFYFSSLTVVKCAVLNLLPLPAAGRAGISSHVFLGVIVTQVPKVVPGTEWNLRQDLLNCTSAVEYSSFCYMRVNSGSSGLKHWSHILRKSHLFPVPSSTPVWRLQGPGVGEGWGCSLHLPLPPLFDPPSLPLF